MTRINFFQDHLAEIRAHPVKQNHSTVRLLCRSLAGNDVYFVTVTSPQIPGEPKVNITTKYKKRCIPGTMDAS